MRIQIGRRDHSEMTSVKGRSLSGIQNFTWNAVGSAANTLTSLLYLIFATRILGKDGAGPFAITFTTAQILLSLGLYGVRNFQVTDTRDTYPAGSYITARLITSAVMLPAGLVFCLFSGYDGEKSWLVVLLLLGKCAESMSDVFYGILQKKGRLDLAGISMTVRAVLSIAVFYITLKLTNNLLLASGLLSACAFVTLLVMDMPFAGRFDSIRPDIDRKALSRLLAVCFPVFAASILSVIVTNMPKYVIDRVMENRFQTIYGIIVMPGTAIFLFSQIVTQSMLTRMAKYRDDVKAARFIKLNAAIAGALVLFAGVCMVFFYFWGSDLLFLIYRINLKEYIPQLLIVLAGALLGSVAYLLSAALTSLRITRIQLWLFLVNLVAALFLSAILVPRYGLFGASISYLFIMLVQLLLYLIVFLYAVFSRKGRAGNFL